MNTLETLKDRAGIKDIETIEDYIAILDVMDDYDMEHLDLYEYGLVFMSSKRREKQKNNDVL